MDGKAAADSIYSYTVPEVRLLQARGLGLVNGEWGIGQSGRKGHGVLHIWHSRPETLESS
jgi:hypothetical protein